MTLYRYKAADASGAVVQGEMEAASQEAVVKRLQAQGHVPIRAEEAGERGPARERPRWDWLRRRRVGRRDVEVFTVELASLLKAGLPLDRALEVLVDLAENDALRQLLSEVQAEVRRGVDLSDALAARGAVFSDFYVNLVRAGEAGGALQESLSRLAEFLERSRTLRDSVTDALIYPAILVTFAISSLILILAFVVPRFSVMFADAGAALPLPTRVVVALGGFMEQYWWLLAAALVLGYVVVRRQLEDPRFRRAWDHRLLDLPLVGPVVTRVEVARFARTLGTLVGNGVPLLDALGVARRIVANAALAEGVDVVVQSVREGRGMARALQETPRFPKLAGHMLKIGEETGNLEEMLFRVADTYDREVKTALHRLVVVLEPVILIGLGLLVAGVILSILVAILRVNELAF